MAEAGSNEIWVSDLTRALADGTGFGFEDRGTHRLKGLARDYHLFAFAAP